MHGADGRLGQRLALRIGIIDARIHPGTLLHYLSEESQLAAGSPYFACQARLGQCGFQMGPLDDRRSGGLDRSSDATQKGALFLAGEIAVNGEGALRQRSRPLQVFGACGEELWL